MTTGRINQVTILSPGAAVRRGPGVHPPRGGSGALRELGNRRSGPSRAGPTRWARRTPTDHSIAPTESPKGRSAEGLSGRETTKPHGMHPSGGGSPPPDQHPRAATGRGTPPEGLGCEQWLVASHP